MCREEQNRTFRHFVDRVDERHTLLRETFDDVLVVNDLVIDEDLRAKHPNGLVEALDGHVDAGTKTTRVRQENLHYCGHSMSKGIVLSG